MRKIVIAFNPVTEQFKVADATTEQESGIVAIRTSSYRESLGLCMRIMSR
jgi:hypothetical protein